MLTLSRVNFRLILCLAVLSMGSIAFGYPPYYMFDEHDKAQAEARLRNLPLAWLGGNEADLNSASPASGSRADLQEMAISTLQDQAVIIFFDGEKKEMDSLPADVHLQFHIHDDGALANNASWIEPKIVFSNPEATQVLGRVSETQMREDRASAINSALQIIKNNPEGMAPPSAFAAPPGAATEPPGQHSLAELSTAGSVLDFLQQYGMLLILAGLVALAGLIWFAWSRRRV